MKFYFFSKVLFLYIILGFRSPVLSGVVRLDNLSSSAAGWVFCESKELCRRLEERLWMQTEQFSEQAALKEICELLQKISENPYFREKIDRDFSLTIGRVFEKASEKADLRDKEQGVVRVGSNKYLPKLDDDELTESMRANFLALKTVVEKARNDAKMLFVQLGGKYPCFSSPCCIQLFEVLLERGFGKIVARLDRVFACNLHAHVFSRVDWDYLSMNPVLSL